MKLVAIRLARSIWLFPTYFANPKGVNTRPAAEGLKARYGFAKSPLDGPPPRQNEGSRFEDGVFQGKNGNIAINSVAIHADGIVVDTRSSTSDGDAFLEDAFSYLSKEHSFPSLADLPAKRVYASELNVAFDNPPKILDPKLASFLKEAGSILSKETGGVADVVGFIVGPNTTSTSPNPFRFEREIGVDFKENRYWSYAPTTTEAHIKLLELL